MKMMPLLAREKTNNNQVSAQRVKKINQKCFCFVLQYSEACADLMETWIDLFLDEIRKKRFHERMICATTWCFQPNCILHNHHFQYSARELKQITMAHQTWRREIQQGSQIDVLLSHDGESQWFLGVVTEMHGEIIQIKFEQTKPEYDTILDIWSTKIAPANQESKADSEWRE